MKYAAASLNGSHSQCLSRILSQHAGCIEWESWKQKFPSSWEDSARLRGSCSMADRPSRSLLAPLNLECQLPEVLQPFPPDLGLTDLGCNYAEDQ